VTKQEFYNNLKDVCSAEESKTLYYLIIQYLFDAPLSSAIIKEMEGLSEEQNKHLEEITVRLKKHEPIQYILGECEFRSLKWFVSSDVLIPRPETSELIDWVIEDWKYKDGKGIDIGTGSGCIAISLKKALPKMEIHATDISKAALEVAKKNAANLDAEILLHHDNILATKLPNEEKYHLIISNPPYIMQREKKEIAPRVMDYEPHTALFVSDEDPLIFYREIANFGKEHLHDGGSIYFEINALLGHECITMLHQMDYKEVTLRIDEYGKERMIRCKK